MTAPDRALLAHADFVARLAQQLLRDQHLADDVVQDTWLSALRSRPRGAGRGWLAAIVRNVARNRLRDRELRGRREAEAVRACDVEYEVSTEDVVQREASRREVVNAVLGLAEPYRSTVLCVYFEGESPARIARRVGIPAATVRSRLKRGLEQLRAALDGRHGGDRREWVTALAPLALARGSAAAVEGVGWGLLLAMIMQQKAIWMVATVVVFAALTGWLVWSGPSDPRGVPSKETTAAVPPAAAPAGAVSAEQRLRRDRVAAAPVLDSEARPGYHFVVLREGSPVADAEVRLVEAGTQRRIESVLVASDEHEAMVVGRTGAGGRIVVPLRGGVARLVSATAGGAWGATLLVPEDVNTGLVREIELGPDHSLRVRVVDGDGQPAGGVAVTFGEMWGPGMSAMRVGHTRSDGIAELSHLQAQGSPDRWRGQLAVAVLTPQRRLARHLFTRDTWPAGVVELRLPSFGSVELRFVDPQGRTWVPPDDGYQHHVQVTVVAVDGEPVQRARQFHRVLDGVAVIEPVGLGLTLRAGLDGRGLAGATGELEFDGPREHGERCEVRVPVVPAPTVSGRLVDTSSEPLVDRAYMVRILHLDRHREYAFGHTAEDGAFRVPMPTLASAALLVFDVRDAADEASQGEAVLATSRLTFAGGDHPVGDLRVGPPALALGGRVIDTRGDPVVDAEVRLERLVEGVPREVHGGEARTSVDGRFEIRGGFLEEGLHASVRARGYQSAPRTAVGLGTRDALFVLQAVGSVSADVLLDEGVGADALLVTLVEHATGTTTASPLSDLFSAKTMRLRSVAPGRFALSIEAAGDPDQLFEFDGEVVAGEVTELEPIDLRGRLHRVRLHVVDESGQPVREVVAMIDPEARSGTPRPLVRSETGMIDVWSARPDPVVTIGGAGYQHVTVRSPRDGQNVVLPGGPTAALRVAVPELPAGVRFEVALQPIAATGRRPAGYRAVSSRGMSVAVGGLREAAVAWVPVEGAAVTVVPASEAGAHRVRARLRQGGRSDGVVLTGPERVIVGSGGPPTDFALTGAEVERCLAERRR